MHADFAQLLAVRDGGWIDPAIEEHIQRCSKCSFELTHLARVKHDLRQLPGFEPPLRTWRAVHERLEGVPQHRARPRSRWAFAAAGGALAAFALGWFAFSYHGIAPTPSSATTRPRTTNSESDEIGTLISRSQRLEAILHTLPPRPNVERAGTSATIDDLQTRIQLVDAQLSDPVLSMPNRDRAARLWSARVELLNSLVHVRYAEAASAGYGSPSTTFGVI
jgi:hypothetical protein